MKMANIDAVFGFMFTKFPPSQQVSMTNLFKDSARGDYVRTKSCTLLICVPVLGDFQNIFFGERSGK